MSIAPDKDVADGVTREDRCEGVGPPVGGLQAFVAGLGECCGLAVLLGNGTDHGEVVVELISIASNADGVGIGRPAVAVEAHEVDDVVAGITFKIACFVTVSLGAWGVGVKGIDDATLTETVDSEPPEGFVLVGGAMVLSPPEPGACMLVPGSEEDGYADAIGCLQRIEEIGYAVKPGEEQLVFGTTVQYGGHGVCFLGLEGVGHPGSATAEGIVEVPAEGDHAATVVVGNDLLADALEGYSIEV